MEIPTQRKDIQALQGIHIFHFPISNCSQRVRIAASEKGIPWTSHVVDLTRGDHTTPEYLQLNPNGVVPVLVHDGRTHIESNDIISYLDETFPSPALKPETASDLAILEALIASSSSAQTAMKLLSHEFLFKPKALKSVKELEAFAAQCGDTPLVRFHREFTDGKGFSPQRIQASVDDLLARFDELETRLNEAAWLSGPQYGLADISWLVNAYRLKLMDFPFTRYPNLSIWLKRSMERPSFRSGISDFESRTVMFSFAAYTAMRKMRRTSIGSYMG